MTDRAGMAQRFGVVADRLPALGANPLQVAFEDYQRMEHELTMATQEHAAKSDMVNDLLRENEFLQRNYDKAVAERDRYQALAVNLATRAVSVREAVERLLSEAVSARAAPIASAPEVGRIVAEEPVGDLTAQMDQLFRGQPTRAVEMAPVRDITLQDTEERQISRTAKLAPNEYR